MPLWVDIVVKLTPAFATLVVGCIASLVAFLQYKINRDKLRLDLFSKHLEAFEKLQQFFTSVLREGCVNDEMLPVLHEAEYKARFLFGSEIKDFFKEVWERAVRARSLRVKLYGPSSLPVGPERTQVCEEESTEIKWMTKEMRNADIRFARYLRFDL